MSSSGVSSSKSTTASTAARAAMTRARSRSDRMGRVGPLSRQTEASALRPRTSFEPKRRQSSSSVMWPTCRRSKQPLVKTMVSPEARHSATRSLIRSRSRIFSPSVRPELGVSAATSSWAAMGTVPTLLTTMPAARFASSTAAWACRRPATGWGRWGLTPSPPPVWSEGPRARAGGADVNVLHGGEGGGGLGFGWWGCVGALDVEAEELLGAADDAGLGDGGERGRDYADGVDAGAFEDGCEFGLLGVVAPEAGEKGLAAEAC